MDTEDNVKKAFEKFDNGTGYISVTQVKDVLLEAQCEKQEAEEISEIVLKKASKDGTDKMSFEEFQKTVINVD